MSILFPLFQVIRKWRRRNVNSERSPPYLVDDVLEQIFDTIHDKNLAPTGESQATFASLSLVSKRFLHLARSRLYYRPLLLDLEHPEEVAPKLISSLKYDGGKLGQLVQSLVGFSHWMTKIPKHLRAMCYELLRACSNIRALSLVLDAAIDLKAVEQALSNTHGIRELLLGTIDPNVGQPGVFVLGTPYGTWGDNLTRSALGLRPFANVSTLDLDLYHHLAVEQLPRSNLLSLRKFTFYAGDSSLSQVMQFFPVKMENLIDFEIAIHYPPTSDVVQILSLLPSELNSITFLDTYERKVVASLEDYRTQTSSTSYEPEIPIPDLQRFSHLTELILCCFRGPSVSFLESLVGSSPLLGKLWLEASYWITEKEVSPQTSNEDYFAFVFQEEEVARVLGQFNKLYHVHLGFLPVVEGSLECRMPFLEDYSKRRKVKVDWNPVLEKRPPPLPLRFSIGIVV
ncbi:hypothetical protein JCM3765_003845 [Sporobolomyces pararoseus]